MKGHKASKTGRLSLNYLINRFQRQKQVENPRSAYDGEETVDEATKRQRELKQTR